MKLKPGTEKEYADYKAKNTDPYGGRVVSYGEDWANFMETRMANGEKIEDIAKQTSHQADTDGITGFMYGCAVKALAYFWEHGETLRLWHNLDAQIKDEGEQANKSGGVLTQRCFVMNENGHWYDWQGQSHHTIDCKTRAGTRPTTLADARRENYLPSVTTVLGRTLAKPQLIDWLRREAAIAAVTTPRQANEDMDSFVDRILAKDSQDSSQQAMDLGGEVHKAIEETLAGRLIAPQFKVFVDAALKDVATLGKVVSSEKVLVNPMGFAGRTDLITEQQELLTVGDFKTAKKIPKSPWPEHLLQVSAYADCLCSSSGWRNWRFRTAVLYISTTNPGETKLFVQDDWAEHFRMFKHVFELWCFLNNYRPQQPSKSL